MRQHLLERPILSSKFFEALHPSELFTPEVIGLLGDFEALRNFLLAFFSSLLMAWSGGVYLSCRNLSEDT